uniref:Uncharacterized protein n=1 Tax=Heterorhabditis bacteriophora TaxID=37862 RepID=A0A1I7W9B7_HETBA
MICVYVTTLTNSHFDCRLHLHENRLPSREIN